MLEDNDGKSFSEPLTEQEMLPQDGNTVSGNNTVM